MSDQMPAPPPVETPAQDSGTTRSFANMLNQYIPKKKKRKKSVWELVK